MPRNATRRALCWATALSASLVVLAATCPAAEAEPPSIDYQPPVAGPVVDPFRPPTTPYGPGNRGVDYATVPGAEVHASAPGQVVFAGRVGLQLHVVVLHADGLRSSYSFLASIAIRRGDRVAAGQVVGTSGTSLHFGFRAGDTYLDPLSLLGRARVRVWLVPDDERRPLAERRERSLLIAGLRGLGHVAQTTASATAAGVEWAAGQAGEAAQLALRANPGMVWAEGRLQPLATTIGEWWKQRDSCTPSSEPAPVLSQRHIAVLVGGLGSASGHASILDIDTGALGYAPADVVQFSYRGGTTSDTSYGPVDTQTDLVESGRRLRELLDRLKVDNPGVEVDVLAHSQGGLVTRLAIGPLPPSNVATIVTLATPHTGADLANIGRQLDATAAGRAALTLAGEVNREGINPESTSVRQLSSSSATLTALNSEPVPAGPRWVAIGGRLDLVVPSSRARLSGAENTVESMPLGFDHSSLPGSAPAQREVALAVTGSPLACRGLADRVVDLAATGAIQAAESLGGLVFAGAAGPPLPPRPPDPTR